MDWVLVMYLSTVVGAVFAVFWPYLVKLFKGSAPPSMYVFDSGAPRFVLWIILGAVIGAVVATLGFATFLGSAENQAALKSLGSVAYFLAFSSGFSAGSLIEEPLKQK